MIKSRNIFKDLKNFEVKKSKNGLGIFAKKDFLAKEILFEIKGKLISCDEDDDLDEETRSNTFRFDEEKYLSPKGQIADFLNHSCEPNSGVVKINNKLFLITILDIKIGEELTMDYSTILASDDVWEMKCNCGSNTCRKIIKKFITLPSGIRKKYIDLGIVPNYIFKHNEKKNYKSEYTKDEIKLFKKLNTPSKIQDYLNKLPFNFEESGETCMSPREVIKNQKAHCMEGAMFAAAVLEFHGHEPLLLDLRSIKKPYDYDHVVAVFKQFGTYGAISKTNHAVLRYREPVYKTLRELALSYFHEYFLNSNGKKTLREYSALFDLNYFNKLRWRTTPDDLFEISHYLDKVKHFRILSKEQEKNLRKADNIEIEAGSIVEYNVKK